MPLEEYLNFILCVYYCFRNSFTKSWMCTIKGYKFNQMSTEGI